MDHLSTCISHSDSDNAEKREKKINPVILVIALYVVKKQIFFTLYF